MTQKSCAVGMRNAILRNYVKTYNLGEKKTGSFLVLVLQLGNWKVLEFLA